MVIIRKIVLWIFGTLGTITLMICSVALIKEVPEKEFSIFLFSGAFSAFFWFIWKRIKNPLDRDRSAALSVFSGDIEKTVKNIEAIPYISKIKNQEEKALAVQSFVEKNLPTIINKSLEDSILTEGEEACIIALIKRVGIKNIDDDLANKIIKASFIRDLLNGVKKESPCPLPLGFIIPSKERFLWAWDSVNVSEMKEFKEFVGGSRGFTVRVCKGVYFRAGNYRGHTETTASMVSIGSGPAVLTNKAIYIHAGIALKYDLTKAIHIQPCVDGVFMQFSGRQKPVALTTKDAWFFANCILNAQNV